MKFNTYTNEELKAMVKEIEAELDNRRNIAKREAWNDVIGAIRNYVINIGNIQLDTEETIKFVNGDNDIFEFFDTPGVIHF